MNLLLYGLLALAIMGAVGTGVYKVKQWGANEVRQEVAARDATALEARRLASHVAATSLAGDRGKARTIIQERTVYVDREITKLVDSGQCFKPTGVVCLNGAIAGKDGSGCKPDGAVPAAKPVG